MDFKRKRLKRVQSVTIKAYAKLNFTLELFGVQDGFHQLDSLVSTIDLYDTVIVKKRKDKLINVVMHGLGSEGIPPECNNAVKAGEAFVENFQTTGADITIFKDIPIGAGLGGSSADAAGVLLGMAKLYSIPVSDELETLAQTLGSDTKYQLHGGFMRMQGRGEKLTKLPIAQTLHILLLCPRTPISTKACFEAYDRMPKTLQWTESATQNCIDAWMRGDVNAGGRYLMNELFTAASALNADTVTALETLKGFSPIGACMSGAGSSVFAVFETKELCEWAKSRYKGNARAFVVKTVAGQESKKKSIFRNPFVLSGNE